jgi:hypothetical protein
MTDTTFQHGFGTPAGFPGGFSPAPSSPPNPAMGPSLPPSMSPSMGPSLSPPVTPPPIATTATGVSDDGRQLRLTRVIAAVTAAVAVIALAWGVMTHSALGHSNAANASLHSTLSTTTTQLKAAQAGAATAQHAASATAGQLQQLKSQATAIIDALQKCGEGLYEVLGDIVNNQTDQAAQIIDGVLQTCQQAGIGSDSSGSGSGSSSGGSQSGGSGLVTPWDANTGDGCRMGAISARRN